jgi:hypothetical protein
MLRLRVGWGVSLVAVSAIALLGFAVAATGRNAASCGARAGTTVLEDATVRVYEARGLDYACTRPTGRAYRLFRSEFSGEKPVPASGIELAGNYSAWSEFDEFTSHRLLVVLDVATGTYRTADAISTIGREYVGGFVVNDHGTVVFTNDSADCVGSASFGECNANSSVVASSVHGNSTLASSANSSKSPAPAAQIPITSLGLSESGTVAFWIDNGTYGGAPIP